MGECLTNTTAGKPITRAPDKHPKLPLGSTFFTRLNFYTLALGEVLSRFYEPRDYGTRQLNAIVRHASRTQIREKFEVYLCCSNSLHKTTRATHFHQDSTNDARFRTLRSTRPERFSPCLLLFPSKTILYAYLTFLVSKDMGRCAGTYSGCKCCPVLTVVTYAAVSEAAAARFVLGVATLAGFQGVHSGECRCCICCSGKDYEESKSRETHH